MPAVETEVYEPDLVRVQRTARSGWVRAETSGVSVTTATSGLGRRVLVATDGREGGAVSRVHPRSRRATRPGARVLGDAWDRSYGDLAWAGLQAERPLPWAVLVHDPEAVTTWGAGVEVRTSAFASWTIDPEGVSLWLDLRAPDRPAGGLQQLVLRLRTGLRRRRGRPGRAGDRRSRR